MSIRTISPLLLVMMTVPCWAVTEVDWYVDPDAVGAGTGTSWTDAYTSWSAFDAAKAKDLSASGERYILHLRSSGGTADTTTFTTSVSWETDDVNYVKVIQEDFPADGKWDATKYRLHNNDAALAAVRLENIDELIIDGLQVHVTGTSSNKDGLYCAGAVATAHTWKRVIVKGDISGSTTTAIGMYVSNAIVTIIDSTVYGFANGAQVDHAAYYGLSPTMTLYNCVGYGCGAGLYRSSTARTIKAYNCVFGNNVDDYFQLGAGGAADVVSYCASEDQDYGSNHISALSSDWDNEFTDANNGDFTQKAGGNIIGSGVDDPGSGAYSTDIIGVAFQTGKWDVGVYSSGGAGGAQIMWLKLEN